MDSNGGSSPQAESVEVQVTKMRGKFRVDEIAKTEHAETLKLSAVYGGDKNSEDNTYSAATPSGTITMMISNKALWGSFKPGDKFYVDFVPAAK